MPRGRSRKVVVGEEVNEETVEVEEVVEEVETPQVEPDMSKLEVAVQYQTNCAKCGANLSQTGYVENNYQRYCGPACAS